MNHLVVHIISWSCMSIVPFASVPGIGLTTKGDSSLCKRDAVGCIHGAWDGDLETVAAIFCVPMQRATANTYSHEAKI